MRSTSVHPPALLLVSVLSLFLSLVLVSCAPTEEAAEDPAAAVWSEAQQLQGEVAAQRAEIAELEAALVAAAEASDDEPAAADEGEAGEGEAGEGEGGEAAEAPPTPEEMQARLDELGSTLDDSSQALYEKLIEYINSSGLVEGEELTAEQRQAFDWKAEEDIRIAQEYIDKGGDYSRAIDIYNTSLNVDPTSQLLLDAKARAERLQHMDEERFSQVKKGMTQEEVRAILGTVHQRNVREYEETNTLGWFYRREDGGAAAVFFKQKNDEWKAVQADFDAVKSPAEGGAEDGAEDGGGE